MEKTCITERKSSNGFLVFRSLLKCSNKEDCTDFLSSYFLTLWPFRKKILSYAAESLMVATALELLVKFMAPAQRSLLLHNVNRLAQDNSLKESTGPAHFIQEIK